MKNTYLLFYSFATASALSFTGCNGFDCVDGSGKQISQSRTVKPFTKVETGGSLKLILKQDANQSVRIVADDNIQKSIETYVEGNTLKIKMDGNFCNTGPITVYLSTKRFEGVEASGAVEVESVGNLQTKDFYLDLSGSSKVTLDLNAANLETNSSGASEIYLKGQASSHHVNMSGSGSVNALDFVVGKYEIESSGASESKINVLNELHVHSSGSSDVKYRGNPGKVTNDESGASSVRKID